MNPVQCHPCVAEHLPRGLGVRLGIGLLIVGQSMIFGLALNLHDDVPEPVRWYAQSAILAATLIVIALLGGPLLAAAWREVRRGRVTIEALFLLTMGGAMAASLQAHHSGTGAVYFEVVSVLLVVYTLGKLIGARSRAAALAAARGWSEAFATCRIVNRGTVPVSEVRAGDCVEVGPGEAIAVDGVIRDGEGFVNEAAVSGEPFAVVRRAGDRLLAGSVSCDAGFRIMATAPGTDRQIDRMLAAVEAAREAPTSMQARADVIGRVFLPVVVIVAIGTFAYWTFAAGWETGLFCAMSVLLVACPCVIGLATPIILWTAINRLAERGVIVRSGDAIERLAEVDRVIFDKTGTLTDERPTLVKLETADERVSGWLAAVQRRSSHPIARAFAELPAADVEVKDLRAVPGCGVIATIENHEVRIGRPEWIANHLASGGRQSPEDSPIRIDASIDGRLAATAHVSEKLRDSAPPAIAELQRLNLPIEVLTGDQAARAAMTALPTRAGLLPEEKQQYVESLKNQGFRPLVVGDGINDASALAAAHASVALASGTDLAIGAADVTLHHGDLRAIPWAIEESRAAVAAVRRNLRRALTYNLAGMALAAAGLLHPIAAALLMVVSSLTLVGSATRVSAGCHAGIASGLAFKACVHGIAFAIQGLVLAELLGLSLLSAIPFAIAGFVLALAWQRRPAISHSLDMCFGMLTLGNLGMLLGWWADLGFHAIRCLHCCSCSDPLAKPWMWLGMLVFANAAMLWLGRTKASREHALAMFTGGNVGMLLGMFAGGAMANETTVASVSLQGLVHFAGMTVGMIAGMLAGTWLVEEVSRILDARRVQPAVDPVYLTK